MTFLPVGAANGRVAVPAGATLCIDSAAADAEIAKYVAGGAQAGQSAVLHFLPGNWPTYGIRDYNCTDGGDGIEIYCDPNGGTIFNPANGTHANANSAIFRIGSDNNQFDPSSKISLYNATLDGNAVLGNTTQGAIWGLILGGSYDGDPNRCNVSDIHIQGIEVRNTRQSGTKIDGNGGTADVTMLLCTVTDTGLQYQSGNSSGFGEGIYVGDGNTGRAYSNVTISQCEVADITMGEGIEFKRNGSGAVCSYNLVHDVTIDSGGGIKNEDNGDLLVVGNRVYNIGTTPDSDVGGGIGINSTGGGIFRNNIVWDCTRACFEFNLALSAGLNVESTHNTLDASGATAAFNFGGNFGAGTRIHEYAVTSTNDIVIGTVSGGSAYAGSNVGGTVTATFVGPTTGTADAGDGPGSGYLVASGAARNSVATLDANVTVDIRGWDRTAPTDAGAYDADATTITAGPATTITSPTGGQQFAVNATPDLELDLTGDEDYDAVGYRLQRDDTAEWWTGTVWQANAIAFEVTLAQPATMPNSAQFSNLPQIEDGVTFTAETRARGVTFGWGDYSTPVSFGPLSPAVPRPLTGEVAVRGLIDTNGALWIETIFNEGDPEYYTLLGTPGIPAL